MFAIPWLGYTWIGTTDTDFDDDPANVRADRPDIDAICSIDESVFQGPRRRPHLISRTRGVRALVMEEELGSRPCRGSTRSAMKPKRGGAALIEILGGKLTGYPRDCRRGDRPGVPSARSARDLPCRHDAAPWRPGPDPELGRGRGSAALRLAGRHHAGAGRRFVREGGGCAPGKSRYGTRGAILQPDRPRGPAPSRRTDRAGLSRRSSLR